MVVIVTRVQAELNATCISVSSGPVLDGAASDRVSTLSQETYEIRRALRPLRGLHEPPMRLPWPCTPLCGIILAEM